MAAPGGAPRPLLLLLLAGLVQGASAVFVVRDGNRTACIMASFTATFSTHYRTAHGSQNITFDLPPSAHVLNSSSCGANASEPNLDVGFGSGHSVSIVFARNATRYQIQHLSVICNFSDTLTFPNSSSKETMVVRSVPGISADMDTRYRCDSATPLHMTNMTVTLHNVTIQAYLSNSTFSKGETRCKQDGPSPTSIPPSPPRPSPSPPPRPSPGPTPASPPVSRYNVSGDNGTCLLASMALQLNVTYARKDNTTVTRAFNINPNEITSGGSCGANLVTLELRSQKGVLLVLQFGMNASASRFFLQKVQLNMSIPDAREPTFQAVNSSMQALQASIGNSYKCNAEERLRVTPAFSLNLFSVWVQAFRVEGDKFGSVEECLLDGNSMLIPIAVGGALAGLVLIVLIAYLIGRKRSHAGYQTI